ncbi:amidophosphoribosyltransferase [Sulfuriroseicoccus oceanibius]|uniref:Amidophosphoribosyltransferase n=1 Tax=Sulfuriroseicoccus oceanibius TaxID=2707525 RepID=A0A6B3L142_9BACT|nr:amidophosphoribosyltransferase [Sulfuriroseicoccus oceanibius]QQL44125.1 amidophosphoribosyltransferase [Sulfuriroseicoccus oceanibius]
MSDSLKHECGLAFIRLRKPHSYFQEKYGTSLYGFQKLFLLMEKQHNRGQDGIGIGSVKLDMPLGQPYIFRERSAKQNGLSRVFAEQSKRFAKMTRKGIIDPSDPDSVKQKFDFGGELLMGHLRYGTSGVFSQGSCHPYLRRTNWLTRTLMVLGNFNMTNAGALNQRLIERGQHPVFGTDTQTVLEEIGFHLDEQHQNLYHQLRDAGLTGQEIQERINDAINVPDLIRTSADGWDGGFSIVGAIGNGDAFVMRDPRGIRPCFYYEDEELIAFASERAPLMTVFDADAEQVSELAPGHVATIKKDGEFTFDRYAEPQPMSHCSFERIYFSRGNDPEIYSERKAMGAALVPQVVKSIGNEIDKTVVSFIPNTAEIAYQGLMDGLRLHRRKEVAETLHKAVAEGGVSDELIDDLILRNWPRGEKIAHKDIKMRTFISQESGRNQLVSHVYDISYGVVQKNDNLVVIDDSIVRGTTLQKSILKILSRTQPKKIVIASTAPQIRYPDCYGIDMSEIGKFIAFRATVSLLKRDGRESLLDEVYEACKRELDKPVDQMVNQVKRVYEAYSDEEIAAEISRMVYPEGTDWDGEVEVVFLSVDDLHNCLNVECGDWYFTGDYPTSGGNAVVNNAFVNYMEKKDGRGYDLVF